MMPTWPRVTRATRSLNPCRPSVVLPVRPRSVSITSMALGVQPNSWARWRRAYWSRRLSWLVSVWCGLDWRMQMRAWRPRWKGVMSSDTFMDNLRVDGGDVIDDLLLQGWREPRPDCLRRLRHG